MAYDVPVQCGDVVVQPGQIVFADYDGIVVIPREVEQVRSNAPWKKWRGRTGRGWNFKREKL